METVRIRDPGWKKVGSGIRDKHPGSATLGATAVGMPRHFKLNGFQNLCYVVDGPGPRVEGGVEAVLWLASPLPAAGRSLRTFPALPSTQY
jgi:hypothetical protein